MQVVLDAEKVDYAEVFVELKLGNERASIRAIQKENQNKEDIAYPCKILFDQSTRSGFSIWDSKKRLVMVGYLYKKDACSVTEYKYILKNLVENFIEEYQVDTIIHEEIYGGENYLTLEVLMYIKHMIKDLEYENENLKVYGFHNRIWKKHLAKPKAFKFGSTEQEKKEVRKLVEQYYPLLFVESNYYEITEDMADSIGMGIGLILNQKIAGNMLNLVQYNKKLPIHQMIVKKEDVDNWEEIINKLRKPYRDAYNIGKVMEIELNTKRQIDEQLKRVLTHIDCVVCVKIPKSYKNWGLILLEQNIKPSDLNGDKSFWVVSVRKKRK